jgi:hypothetical protein
MKRYSSNLNKVLKVMSFSLISLTLLGSCQKLEESPESFVTPESYYKTKEQIETVFASSMNNLWNVWSNYSYTAERLFRNDDQLYGGNLDITADWGSGLWAAHFKSIYDLNNAIGVLNVGIAGVSPTDADQLLGQAKFLRAYNYFMLVRMWGGLPIVDETNKDPLAGDLARSSVQEVYDFIVSDFKVAIEKLPATWSEDKQGRPTQDAAKAMLAKVYLTMATYPLNKPAYYKDAADYSKQVIDAGNYELVTDIKKVFSSSTKYAPENMWGFNSNEADKSTTWQQWSNYYGWGVNSVKPTFESTYPDQPRKYEYLELTFEGKSFKELGVNPGVGKFVYDRKEGLVDGLVNIPIIRYADVLLIYAEAKNRLNNGPEETAVAALNQVISRANGNIANAQDPLATSAMSVTAFENKVLQERSWELCFEFDRWFDIIRKRVLLEVTLPAYKQNFSEADYLFPIPIQDMRLNKNFSQNPGY